MGGWSAEGVTEEVDLTPVIMQYRVFQPLRGDIKLFASVQLGEDGNSLIWDKGRIDMAATTVERLAAKSMRTRNSGNSWSVMV